MYYLYINILSNSYVFNKISVKHQKKDLFYEVPGKRNHLKFVSIYIKKIKLLLAFITIINNPFSLDN